MIKLRFVATLFFLTVASVVFAHPGHPTLNPHHTHGALELNPIALILLAAIVIGVILIGRRAVPRHTKSWRVNRK
jgi:hypothetical protein